MSEKCQYPHIKLALSVTYFLDKTVSITHLACRLGPLRSILVKVSLGLDDMLSDAFLGAVDGVLLDQGRFGLALVAHPLFRFLQKHLKKNDIRGYDMSHVYAFKRLHCLGFRAVVHYCCFD